VAVEEIAGRHAERQVQLARRTARELGRLWRMVDLGNIRASWTALLPHALTVLGSSQATAAATAGLYVDDVLTASEVEPAATGRVNPGAFAGIASDGRPIASLLYEPVILSLSQLGQGASPARAAATGRFLLELISRTQIADAGRVAVGASIAARPEVRGYVRMVVGKTCSRCLVLAGRRYEWNQGFLRHPRCDCRHIPVAEHVPNDVSTDPKAYFDSLAKAEQDELLGRAGADAVRAGADLAKVVNARRGMTTASIGGRRVLTTTEAPGRRPRLMPEAILDASGGDRKLAVRLLKQHGYLI
jgi:hypothetical protein